MKTLHAFFYNRFVFLATMLLFAGFFGFDLAREDWPWLLADTIFLVFDIFTFGRYTKVWGPEND